MITAIDTNILIDIFIADKTFGARSHQALRDCLLQGNVVACDVVWAEIQAQFPKPSDALSAMERLQIHFLSGSLATAQKAGDAFSRYRRDGGPKARVVADFLIGAHALTQTDRLLSRDRGFYRTYFQDLTVVDPAIL